MSDFTYLITDSASADALVATIKASVNGAGKYATFVANNNVTRESVKDFAAQLAMLAYPNDKPVQKIDGKRTRFGNAVQAAGNGLRSALNRGEMTESDVDYLARMVKACEAALTHGHNAAELLAAVTALTKA